MLSNIKAEINKAVQVLKNNGLIIYPTETVWGLGCNAEDEKAITKIYTVKKRDSSKPLLVLVNSVEMIKEYSPNLSVLEIELLKSEEPTTVILSNIEKLPNNLKGPNQSLAFRITSSPICLSIIEKTKQPLVSTSANFSGEATPNNHSEISNQLIQKVSFLFSNTLDSNEPNPKPSRIVQVVNNQVNTIRE